MSNIGDAADYATLMELLDRAEEGVEDMRRTGCAYAKNRQAYEIAKARRTLELRMEGTPVTLVPTLIKNFDDVNEAQMLKDSSEALYAAAKESVNVTKLKIRILESQINREWYAQPPL